MRNEPFAIESGNAIVQEVNEYSITAYCTRDIMQKLNESRKACSASCDVIITVGDERFSCHRAILMECIPYFDKMFRSGFKESSENVITLKNLDAKAFAAILESMYIGELKLPLPEDIAGALNIMTVCDYLGLAGTLDKCLDFFRRYLNSDTVFGICACIVETGCNAEEDLSKMVYNFILENFRAIYRSERFHSMPYSVLEEVVKDDLVNATENEILSAIDKWVSHDERNRLKFVNQLTDAIRIPYLYSLSGIGDNRSSTTRTILNRVRSLQARVCHNLAIAEVSGKVNTVAVPPPVHKRPYKNVYFSVYRELENITDVFRSDGKSLKPVPSMSEDGSCRLFQVVKLESNLDSYTVDDVHNTRFRCFNNANQCWLSLRNPPFFFYSQVITMVSLTSLQCVYYLSYTHSSDRLLCYIPELDVWFKAPIYPDGFHNNCRVTADDDNNVIYSFGNHEKKMKSYMLDVRVGKWSKITSLSQMRKRSAAAFAENKVFVTGGCNSSGWCGRGFVYNIRSDSWSSLPQMLYPVPEHLLLPFENHLWAIGKDCVTTYSLSDRRWSSDVPTINAERGNFIYSATVD